MRVVVAACEVEYRGRLSTNLPAAVRAIMLKADGSIAVHAETSGIKPLNWMTKTTTIDMPDYRSGSMPVEWVFATRKESLTIRLLEVVSDTDLLLDHTEPGLQKSGTEFQVQAWLAENPHLMEDGLRLLGREYPTGHGPVDLLCEDAIGQVVAVEVKRVASMDAVDQVSRYVAALEQDPQFAGERVRGMVAALDVRPRARSLAEKRGFDWVEVCFPEP